MIKDNIQPQINYGISFLCGFAEHTLQNLFKAWNSHRWKLKNNLLKILHFACYPTNSYTLKLKRNAVFIHSPAIDVNLVSSGDSNNRWIALICNNLEL